MAYQEPHSPDQQTTLSRQLGTAPGDSEQKFSYIHVLQVSGSVLSTTDNPRLIATAREGFVSTWKTLCVLFLFKVQPGRNGGFLPRDTDLAVTSGLSALTRRDRRQDVHLEGPGRTARRPGQGPQSTPRRRRGDNKHGPHVPGERTLAHPPPPGDLVGHIGCHHMLPGLPFSVTLPIRFYTHAYSYLEGYIADPVS